jgi:hypothetical protein
MSNKNRTSHILVINDTKRDFKSFLEEEGYQVSFDNFSTMDAALKTVDTKQLDPETAAIPTVVCTAAVRRVEQTGGHLRSMGVEVVLKPFDIDHILETVRRALNPLGKPDAPGVPPSSKLPSQPNES